MYKELINFEDTFLVYRTFQVVYYINTTFAFKTIIKLCGEKVHTYIDLYVILIFQ